MKKRTIKKTFRFTSEEWSNVAQKSKQADITETQYIQQFARTGKVISQKCKKEQKALIMEIAKVENRLYQIAHQLNNKKRIDVSILKVLLQIEKIIKEALPP